jgi:hypothetical protein
MVAASGEGGGEEQREEAEAHRLDLLSHWRVFVLKNLAWWKLVFTGGPAEFRCFVMVFGGEFAVKVWFFRGGWEGDF